MRILDEVDAILLRASSDVQVSLTFTEPRSGFEVRAQYDENSKVWEVTIIGELPDAFLYNAGDVPHMIEAVNQYLQAMCRLRFHE